MMIDTIRPARVGEFSRGGGIAFRKRVPKSTTGGSDIQKASDAEPTNILTTSTVAMASSPQTTRLLIGFQFLVATSIVLVMTFKSESLRFL